MSEAQLAQVDQRFEQVLKAIEPAKAALAIVLTNTTCEKAGLDYYVYYEPCSNLVLVLNPIESQATCYFGDGLVIAEGPRFRGVLEKVRQRLREDRAADALLLCIEEACELIKLAGLPQPCK